MGQRIDLLLAGFITGVALCSSPAAWAQENTVTISADVSTGAMMWGATGFLYGLSESPNLAGYSLDDALLTGLGHLGYTTQKPPGGLQHPDGDALKVADQFKRTGGKGVGIYVQDYYSAWPYQDYGLASYLSNVVDKVCASVAADANRRFMHYVPFNEPDWIWYSASGPRFEAFLADWKTVTDRIRADDPGAQIAGPNFSFYNQGAYARFMAYAKDHDCLPDIITWHELDGSLFHGWYDHYDGFRGIETALGLAPRPIFINEYGRSGVDLNVPGHLVQYITRFENSKVYAGLAFWTGIGDLNDLVATRSTSQRVPGSSLNLPDGAWYLYEWYGHMEGNSVQVTLPERNGSLQLLASRSANSIRAIFGGAPDLTRHYDVQIVVKGIPGASASYRVLETDDTGRDPAPEPAVVLSGTAPLVQGAMTITVEGCKGLSAYSLEVN